MINRQQGESAANDTIPLKKKNCGGYSWHYKKVLSVNQRNILYFQEKDISLYKISFLIEPVGTLPAKQIWFANITIPTNFMQPPSDCGT